MKKKFLYMACGLTLLLAAGCKKTELEVKNPNNPTKALPLKVVWCHLPLAPFIPMDSMVLQTPSIPILSWVVLIGSWVQATMI